MCVARMDELVVWMAKQVNKPEFDDLFAIYGRDIQTIPIPDQLRLKLSFALLGKALKEAYPARKLIGGGWGWNALEFDDPWPEGSPLAEYKKRSSLLSQQRLGSEFRELCRT